MRTITMHHGIHLDNQIAIMAEDIDPRDLDSTSMIYVAFVGQPQCHAVKLEIEFHEDCGDEANGVTPEAVLAILIDHIAPLDNYSEALEHLKEALGIMQYQALADSVEIEAELAAEEEALKDRGPSPTEGNVLDPLDPRVLEIKPGWTMPEPPVAGLVPVAEWTDAWVLYWAPSAESAAYVDAEGVVPIIRWPFSPGVDYIDNDDMRNLGFHVVLG